MPVPQLGEAERRQVLVEILPVLRGAISAHQHQVLCIDTSPAVLDFASREHAPEVAQTGSACPDHIVHTKHYPLFLEWDGTSVKSLKEQIPEVVARYRKAYRTYFEAYRTGEEHMFDSAPRVVLIPGVGMITAGRDIARARVSRDLYHRAVAVMRGATILGQFVSLTPEEGVSNRVLAVGSVQVAFAPT